MVKAILTSLILGLTFTSLFGQVQIKLPQRLRDKLSVEELKSFFITNTSANEITCHVLVTVRDNQNNLLLEISSRPFKVSVGFRYYSSSYLAFNQPRYQNPTGNEKIGKEVLLQGINDICVVLINEQTSNEESEDCQSVGESIIPPHLNQPIDRAEVRVGDPVFEWFSPAPVSNQEGITYKLRIVELLPHQSLDEAFSLNPVFFFTEIQKSIFQLPLNANLKLNTSYAWQVNAYLGDQYLGESEVWVFTYSQEQPPKKPKSTSSECYALLKSDLDASCYYAYGKLMFALQDDFASHNYKFRFLDEYMKEVAPKGLKLKEKAGYNQFSIDLSKYKVFEEERVYILEVISPQNEHYWLKFKYMPATNKL